MLMRLLNYLEQKSRWFLLAVLFLFILLLGLIDELTGKSLSFAVFYLFPVALAAWSLGRRTAMGFSLLSALVWMEANLTDGQRNWITLLDVISRLIFFLIISFLVAALRASLEKEKESARTDYLTKAANARAFYESAESELQRARRYQRPFTMIYFDLDNFKAVNDGFGHSAGDRLLCCVSQSLKAMLRRTDVIARLGGDEFAILLPEAGTEEGRVVAEKLHQRLTAEMQEHQWPVTCSMGVLTCLGVPDSLDSLIRKADELAYAAKTGGKNTIRYDVVAAR